MYSSLLLGLAVSLGAPAVKDPPKKDTPSIVGEWQGETGIRGGKQNPTPPTGVTFTFTADGKFKVKDGANETPDTATYKIDAKKSPAEIDLESGTGDKSLTLGIYKIDGDTLTICFTRSRDGERPAKFESPEGSRTTLMTFKRVKK